MINEHLRWRWSLATLCITSVLIGLAQVGVVGPNAALMGQYL